jgi:signal recognition particle subunit SRP54
MVELLGDKKQELNLKGPDTHSVILLAGLQGSGKTTTASKLALFLKKKGRKPLLIAADLIRPAAIEQLSILGKQAGIEVYKEDAKDPVSVVRNGIKHAIRESFDTVIIDTTGRLQINEEMMSDLKKIKAASEPVETLLVADAMTGQNAVEIASEFNEKIDISGIILTKFDSDTRGGAALSIKSITGKPIKFIGISEKIDGIEPFYPERMASRILGMGDIVTLVEKAQETIEVEEALSLQKKIEDNTFTLEDYLDQFKRVKKMGSLKSLVDMIPGMASQINEDSINEKEMKFEEAIILSMTRNERKNYRIISPSRKSRIAKGSGTSVYLVNRLLKKFEKTKLMMRKMSTNKSYQSKILSQLGGME